MKFLFPQLARKMVSLRLETTAAGCAKYEIVGCRFPCPARPPFSPAGWGNSELNNLFVRLSGPSD